MIGRQDGEDMDSGRSTSARRSKLLAAAVLTVVFILPVNSRLAAQRDTTVHPSPVGVWLFSGGEAPRMRMIFSDDGRLRFDGGFEFYNPASWELAISGARAILAISSPGFTAEALRIFQNRAERRVSIAPDSVDVTAKTVYYDLSESPCRIDFANWFFERRSSACVPVPGPVSSEAHERRAGRRAAPAEAKSADADTAERGITRPQPTMPADEAVARWVGTRHPPLPEDVVNRGGATIGFAGEARYTFGDVIADGRHMLWLERIVDRTPDGRAVRVVLDALVVPEPARTEGWRFVYGLCGTLPEGAPARPEAEDLEPDPEIVAIARFAKAPVLTRIDRAWRADRGAGRFIALPTRGIGCLNETPSWAW